MHLIGAKTSPSIAPKNPKEVHAEAVSLQPSQGSQEFGMVPTETHSTLAVFS